MNDKKLQALVLAAGKSTRFNTGRTKLVEKICGREMIIYATKLLEALNIPTTLIIGYQAEMVREAVTKYHDTRITFIVQSEQKGTGHAVLCTKDQWYADNILIMNGDTPLVKQETIEQLIQMHENTQAAITFVVAHNGDPSVKGYGRIINDIDKKTIKIVEAKEFEGNAQEQCCLNAGIYLIKKSFLEQYLPFLAHNVISKEYYLTDLIHIASNKGHIVQMIQTSFDTIRGINTLRELWTAEQIKRSELITHWMEHGVRFYAAQTVHIDADVAIGAGSDIGCGVHIINGSRIGTNCSIEAFSIINNATIENNVMVRSHSVIENSHIGSHAYVGPFAHIRTGSVLAEKTTIGNFVEVKKSTIGSHSKAKHLSFIGDAHIGSHVNIGAGTITCNYNGFEKHVTTIADNTFIGSNNTLVAPVTIGKQSYTAAGSVITTNVPDETLALGRARQVNKVGYSKKLPKKQAAKTNHDPDTEIPPFIAAIKTNNDSTSIEE